MDKKYISTIINRTARPRSERLRKLGLSGSSNITVNYSGQSQSMVGGTESHSHPNLPYLSQITTDNDGYLYLTLTQENEDGTYTTNTIKVFAGYADESKHATESDYAKDAGHAKDADKSKDTDRWNGNLFESYLNQPVRVDDIVHFLEVIAEAFKTVGYKAGESGAAVDKEGNAETKNLIVRELAQMAKASVDTISSKEFVSGFPEGNGWAIMPRKTVDASGVTNTKYYLEIDDIVARGTMRVYEFIISQLLGMNGTHMVTDMMKVDHIDASTNTIYLDTDGGVLYNPFRAGDLLMVQQYSGSEVVKQYQLEVVSAKVGNTSDGDNRVDEICYKNFIGDISVVAARDVLTRVDSTTDNDRKGTIKMTATEPDSPYIDVIYGMLTDPDNALKLRLGRLNGILTYLWGRLNGYGLYSENAYLTGEFRLKNGKDIKTQFEILEGKMQSAMQGIVNTMQEEDNYLANATFKDNLKYWVPAHVGSLFMVGDGLLDIVSGYYSDKVRVAEAVEYDGRLMLRIKCSSITQNNDNIRKPDNLEDNKLYLTIKYRCIEGGLFTAGFAGSEIYLSEELEVSDDYITQVVSGMWNGQGDFHISFTGDMYIESIMLTNHPLEDYMKEVSTQFEQTSEYISAVATRVMTLEIASAGWITTADGNLLWADKSVVDKLGNTVSTHSSQISQASDNISVVATRVTTLETASAGWITSAEGNLLWADKSVVDELGNTVSAHSSQISQASDNISAVATRVTTLETASAGWITSADGNKLWASKTIESGDSIISYINQTATTLTISASRIDINGAVSFSSLDSNLQSTLNGKADSDELGALATKSLVDLADLGSTIIVGGYLQTNLINADALVVRVIDTYPSRTSDKSRLDGEGLSIYNSEGLRKCRIDNKTVGYYDDMLFSKNANYLSSGLTLQRQHSIYVYSANVNIYFPDVLIAFLNLGYCDKNSVIQVDAIDMKISFTTSNEHIRMYASTPAFVCALYKDGSILESAIVPASFRMSNGSVQSVTISPSFNHTVTDDGTYSVRVYTYRYAAPSTATSSCYVLSDSGSGTCVIDISSTFKYKLSRTNYEYTHIGNDGMMQVMGNGLMFSSSTEFVVRRGNYMLKLSSLGLYKSADAGQSWTTL